MDLTTLTDDEARDLLGRVYADVQRRATLATAPARPRDLKPRAPDAAKILQGNVYGWFERLSRGVYGLTPAGKEALVTWAAHLPRAG